MVRAVAMIMVNNYNLMVPCHRVIRSDGSLGGYNRGGTEAKRVILEDEIKLNMFNDSTLTRLEREQEGNRREEHQNLEELRKLQANYQSDLSKLHDKFGRETREIEDKRKYITHRISDTDNQILRRRDQLLKEHNNSLKK